MFVTAFEYALAVLLAGYAFLGKGFALLNIPLAVPIYVGELVLALGVLAAVTRPGVVGRAFRSRAVWIYAAFALWGVVETLPYLSYFGLDAVRDAVLYYYGLFMVLTAGVVVRREQMERAARVFARLAPWFLLFAPVAVVASAVLRGSLPSVAGTTPVLVWKPGDVAVHVGMVLVFLLVMPGRRGLDRAHAAPLRSKGPWLTRRLTLSIALCLVALTPTLSSRSAAPRGAAGGGSGGGADDAAAAAAAGAGGVSGASRGARVESAVHLARPGTRGQHRERVAGTEEHRDERSGRQRGL